VAPRELDVDAFRTERAIAALDKYAAVTRLTVRVYDRDQRMIAASPNGDRLVTLFSQGREPTIVGDCLRRCLVATERDAVVVERQHGIAVIGVPLYLQDTTLCVATAAYALSAHPDELQVERLARETAVSFDGIWKALRKRLPLPDYRLVLYGELLRIIGETLLTEYSRSQRLEEMLASLAAAMSFSPCCPMSSVRR
jgi:hypothetical protein